MPQGLDGEEAAAAAAAKGTQILRYRSHHSPVFEDKNQKTEKRRKKKS